jgi:hypothetical protein
VDALANVGALTLSIVQKLSRFLYTFRFYVPLFTRVTCIVAWNILSLGFSFAAALAIGDSS